MLTGGFLKRVVKGGGAELGDKLNAPCCAVTAWMILSVELVLSLDKRASRTVAARYAESTQIMLICPNRAEEESIWS